MPRRATHEHTFADRPLGYRPSPDKKHYDKFPARLADVNPLEEDRPFFRNWKIGVRYDQGVEGACAGMATAAWASSFDAIDDGKSRQFDAFWAYKEAQKIDEWPGEDYNGTSIRAVLEIGRTVGYPIKDEPQSRVLVKEYRWAMDPNDVLDWIAHRGPAIFGMNWYETYDAPVSHPFNGGKTRKQFFIGEGDLGNIRGGHAIIANGYYRNRYGNEWIRFQNSWGFSYPLVWLPRATLEAEFSDMEIAFVTQAEWQQTDTI